MRTADSADIGRSIPLERLITVLLEHPVQLAILFGSHATGTTHRRSDIDIAVEFESHRPPDEGYNDVFLGLSADLSDALHTDHVDLVDIHSLESSVVKSVFDQGILLVGEQSPAAALRQQLAIDDSDEKPPRERLDMALKKIDAHLNNDDTAAPAAGDSRRNS